ncbi:MAG TPA: hypothetical protein VE978_00350 [Chitinophagales bacterium]|nr:hypothetical protein [Chitinophagales bacterium]
MKLRFDKNSIRLRVKKSELLELQQKNFVQENISFPNGSFSYKLSISNLATEVETRTQSQSIEVIIPSDMAALWMNDEEVGIYHAITFGNNESINVIIEKDFPCKDKSEEVNQDTFVELAAKHSNDQC